MRPADKREQVREIVARALAQAGDREPFGDDDSLVVSGRLSSLDIVHLLVSLEGELGLVVAADEFDPLRFDSITSIVEMLG